jgi:hypothetical protein
LSSTSSGEVRMETRSGVKDLARAEM